MPRTHSNIVAADRVLNNSFKALYDKRSSVTTRLIPQQESGLRLLLSELETFPAAQRPPRPWVTTQHPYQWVMGLLTRR